MKRTFGPHHYHESGQYQHAHRSPHPHTNPNAHGNPGLHKKGSSPHFDDPASSRPRFANNNKNMQRADLKEINPGVGRTVKPRRMNQMDENTSNWKRSPKKEGKYA